MGLEPQPPPGFLLGGDGGAFTCNAPFYGSTGNIKLNKPAVGMAATSDFRGRLTPDRHVGDFVC